MSFQTVRTPDLGGGLSWMVQTHPDEQVVIIPRGGRAVVPAVGSPAASCRCSCVLGGWVPLVIALLAAAILALICVPFAGAQEAQPAPAPTPCDPAVTACLSVEKIALALRAWSPGATDPRDLAGGRLQAELRRGRWRVQARLDGTATSGAYKAGDWSTVRDVEAHAAVVYDLLRLPQGISVGPMAAIGGAAALPEDGIRASLGRSVTAVLGVAGSWRGGRIHLGIGQAHPLNRGLAAAATWQIPLSDRTASLGYVAIGRRHVPATDDAPAHSTEAIVAWIGLGIRL